MAKTADRIATLMLIGILIVGGISDALGATRTFTVSFSHDCMTVEGDTLDEDGDGICEALNGYRIYTEQGEFITGLPEDGTRTHEFRYNAPWGVQCLKMTAHMTDPIDPATTLESDFSNTGACLEVRPGKPTSPSVSQGGA